MSKIIYKNALINDQFTDITVENGKIISLEKTNDTGIDLKGKKTFAGLIDIHTHGCVGCSATGNSAQELEKICIYEAENGITAFYPTTVTESKEKMLAAVSRE
ncbi:MAG: hypothetical protein E7551_00335, partial [Ruminococcaceae bacterium]|nr:hypothetical protein [Oscillospiraceae bacterium]